MEISPPWLGSLVGMAHAWESTSSLGMLPPSQGHRERQEQNQGTAQTVRGCRESPGELKEQPWHPDPVYRTPWRAPHLHRTFHTVTTGTLSSGCLHIPPKPGGEEKGHTWEASAQPLLRPIKAEIKGLQEQL